VKQSALRRRAAVVVLALLAVVLFQTVSRDLPREQTLIFRFPLGERTDATELTASFTRVGEREARAGVTLSLREVTGHDIRCSVHLPNGDYIVTVELTETASAEHGSSVSDNKSTRPIPQNSVAQTTPSAGASAEQRAKPAELREPAERSETTAMLGSAIRSETMVVRRVTLEGAESIVPLGARTSE
jgi:hypothetical protein